MDIIKFAGELNDLIAENQELRHQNALLSQKVEKYEQHLHNELDGWSNLYGGIINKLVNKD